jgi:hypothetical protein
MFKNMSCTLTLSAAFSGLLLNRFKYSSATFIAILIIHMGMVASSLGSLLSSFSSRRSSPIVFVINLFVRHDFDYGAKDGVWPCQFRQTL